jgi:hypothetical protein
MPTWAELKSTDQANAELDALEATLPETDTTTIPPLRAIAQVSTTATKDVHTATADPKLTPLGQREAVATVLTTAREALTPHQASADRLAAMADATRASMLQFPATFTPDAAISREIRDRLQGADPLQVRVQYFGAIGRGDWAFVHAVEQAPQAFALIDEDTRVQGDAMQFGRHALKATLDAQELAARRRASVVATVKTELKRLAKAYGLPGVED